MNHGVKRLIAGGFAAVLAIGLSIGEGVHIAAAPARDTPVMTTIADSVGGYRVRIESDLMGPYVNTSQVQSLVQGTTGDWTLTTYYGRNFTASNRSVFFDLTEPVAATNPTPPMTAGYVQSHLIAKCHMVNVGLLQIPAGTTVQCPGAFRFQAANQLWYRLSFQPDNFPEVDRMNVTCKAADAAGCKLWTITPSGTTVTAMDTNRKNINKLVQIDPNNDAVLADLGDYYLSFLITVAR